MEKFVVHGGIPLSGSITPSGNKNEALPVLAATLLAQEPVILHNVPDILDITIMRGLLESLGVEVKQIDKHSFSFDPGNLQSANPDSTQASRIRGSFLLAGPVLIPVIFNLPILIQLRPLGFVDRSSLQGPFLPARNQLFCLLQGETELVYDLCKPIFRHWKSLVPELI